MLAAAHNILYRRSTQFSPPNRQLGQQWGTFLPHPKSSIQSQVKRVVQGLIPEPTGAEAGGSETAPLTAWQHYGCKGAPAAPKEQRENLVPSKFSWEEILVFFNFPTSRLKVKLAFLVQVNC